MNFQGGWSFHDWAEAIKNGVCPPNQEIIRLFQVNVEPETEIAQVAWGAYREYGSSTKKLLDKFNPGDEIQEMVTDFN